jgi:hypothetical protein
LPEITVIAVSRLMRATLAAQAMISGRRQMAGRGLGATG